MYEDYSHSYEGVINNKLFRIVQFQGLRILLTGSDSRTPQGYLNN